MRIFHFKYDGVWLGGVVIVLETDETRATQVAKSIVQQSECNPDTVELYISHEVQLGTVAYNWNGDY